MIMRNAILMLLAACVFMPMLCGCSNDEEVWFVDFNPIEIKISVVNADGDNLLDTETTGNILSEPMTYTYNGETLDIEEGAPWEHEGSRYYMPAWFGVWRITDNGKPIIYVGEFDATDLTPRPIDLTLAGIKHTISLTTKEIPPNADTPYQTYAHRLYLDGQEIVSAFDNGPMKVNLTIILDR